MRRLQFSFALLVLLVLTASDKVMAQEWTVEVDANGGVSKASFGDTNEITDAIAKVKVTAAAVNVFNDLELWIAIGGTDTTQLSTTDTGSTRTYQIQKQSVVQGGSSEARTLVVKYKKSLIKQYRLKVKADADAGGSSFAQQLDYPCSFTANAAYDSAANHATIVVSPIGNVYSRSLSEFDENDKLSVIVVGHPELVHRLKVRRVSAFRQTGTVRIIGEGETGRTARQAEVEVVECDQHTYEVEDFEPGRGVVEISTTVNGHELPLGSFDFPVLPLYSGIFSLGGIWTENVDPKFRVINPGTGPIVSAELQGDREFFWSFMYTPFVWGKRKETDGNVFDSHKFWRHINPSFGLVLDDIDDNFLVGLTLDLPRGFLISYGWHLRKITVLDENSGLAPGSPFTGDPATLPTAKSWEDAPFWSVTIDLRAMTKVFRTAASAK